NGFDERVCDLPQIRTSKGANDTEDRALLEPSDQVGVQLRRRQGLEDVAPVRMLRDAAIERDQNQDEGLPKPIGTVAFTGERVPEKFLRDCHTQTRAHPLTVACQSWRSCDRVDCWSAHRFKPNVRPTLRE